MFVERLLAGLAAPQGRLGELDDALFVDIDHYRALLMRTARSLSEAGELDQAVTGWVFACIAEGWVDEHLHSIRDGLIELGAVSEQVQLDHLLNAAVMRVLGVAVSISAADALVLDTVSAPQPLPGTTDLEPLGLRLLSRRYSFELGLLCRVAGRVERTPIGDTMLRLPRQNQVSFLLSLEMLQSAGATDRWRTPRRALCHMLDQHEFDVPTMPNRRRQIDPENLLSWRRIRRLSLMGICECVSREDDADGGVYRYRLLPHGAESIRTAVREPSSELVQLAESQLAEQTKAALRPFVTRSRPVDTRPVQPRDVSPPKEPGRMSPMRPAVAVPYRPTPPVQAAASPVQMQSSAKESTTVSAPPTLSNGVPDQPMGRLESRVQDALNQDLDLAHIVQRAWEEIQARQVSFSLNVPPVRLKGERRALLQAFRELLRSAADAAEQGSVRPSVCVEVESDEDDIVVLVQDSGPSLSASDRESLLDPTWGLLNDGPRVGLVRAQRAFAAQGAALSLPASSKDGTVVRVALPRARKSHRYAA